MKILRSIHSLNPAIGGPMESVKQSSIVLQARGHSVDVACLDSPGKPWLRDFPVPVHAFGPGLTSYGYTARFTHWLEANRSRYDAVIVQGIWQYNSFGVWRAVHGTSTPYFVFPHGMLDPWFNRTYRLKYLKKLIYWSAIEHRVLRDAAAVLFTSEEERRLARESFALYSCNEQVVSYGTAVPSVDLETAKVEFLNTFPKLRGKRLLLFLGRLHEKKGCDILIKAFGSAPADDSGGFHLVMAGPAADAAYLEELKQLAKNAGAADAITFAGMLDGTLKWGAFRAADVFILPSHQENFGISVAESLACGTPVLISNKINIWREIVEECAGFAEEDDLAGTERLIQRWRTTSSEQQQAMRRNARQCFDRHFEINRAVDSLLEVLQHSTK